MEVAVAQQGKARVYPLPQPWRRILLFALDCLALGLALPAAGIIVAATGWPVPSELIGLWPMLLVFGGWLLLYYLNRHYDTRVSHRLGADVASFIKTTLLAAALGSLLVWLSGAAHTTLWPLPLAGGGLFVFLGLLLRHLGWGMLADGERKLPLLVVGSSTVLKRVAQIVSSQPWGPFRPPETIALPHASGIVAGGRELAEALLKRCADDGNELAVVVADERSARRMRYQLGEPSGHRTMVWDLAEFAEQAARLVPMEALNEEWAAAHLTPPHVSTVLAKRVFDLVLGFIFFLIGLPLGLLVSVLIELDAPGSVFYLQPRIGFRNRRFQVFKFRTMDQPRELSDTQWASVNDPRVTRFGRILRLYRLNELPQLINVLLGNTSLVGPRPELPDFVRLLSSKIPCYNYRHLMKPGMTGWAQVNFRYGASVDEARIKLEYDLYYVRHCTVWFDIYILLRTIVIVLGGKGR